MASTRPVSPADPRAAFLADLLARAGRASLDRFRSRTVRRKADGSKVTDADLVASDILLAGLSDAFPGEAIVSEEAPPRGDVDGAAVWHVDPLDGTSAFVEGLAHWGPTVARVVDGALEIGAFHTPATGEQWFARRGAGAWRDGIRLAPPPVDAAEGSHTVYLPSAAHRLPALPWRGKSRGLGSSAAHLAQVASGGGAATIVPMWKLWDVGCGILLVEEAGRVVTDLSGAPFDPVRTPGVPLVAAAPSELPRILDAIRHVLRDAPES